MNDFSPRSQPVGVVINLGIFDVAINREPDLGLLRVYRPTDNDAELLKSPTLAPRIEEPDHRTRALAARSTRHYLFHIHGRRPGS